MDFEWLPNEIFLDLFDYFDGNDLFHAFYGLNSRFNQHLYEQYRTFRFNFSSISKRQFDTICQQHLPIIADRVIALSFSDCNDIPEQIDLFFSYIPSLHVFSRLRSISLSDIVQHETVRKMIDQCHHLSHLTHFKCHFNYFPNYQENFQSMIDIIWSLPKLVHCETNLFVSTKRLFHTSAKISMSLEYLSLNGWAISCNQVNELFQYTPRLKHLSISIEDYINDYMPTLLPTLAFKMNTSPRSNNSNIVLLLKNMPNLQSLQIDVLSGIIDGYQWQDLITNYLPKLKKFRFRMVETIGWDKTVSKRMNELIEPFRSSFWIAEHRWFVRCFILERTVHLCTLPNTFPQVNVPAPDFFMSTDPDDDLQKCCNDTTEITNVRFFNDPKLSNIRLTNIQDLCIEFPIHDQFWVVVPSLSQLQSLTVYANVTIPSYFFQALSDRASHLRQLTIRVNRSSFLKMSSLKHIKPSLRQRNIQHDISYFNEEECLAFAHSPLVSQCEELSINVRNGESILALVHNMSRLQLLKIRCRDVELRNYLAAEIDNFICEQNVSAEDELVEWLNERLPPTYLISRCRKSTDHVRIWM